MTNLVVSNTHTQFPWLHLALLQIVGMGKQNKMDKLNCLIGNPNPAQRERHAPREMPWGVTAAGNMLTFYFMFCVCVPVRCSAVGVTRHFLKKASVSGSTTKSVVSSPPALIAATTSACCFPSTETAFT